MSLSRVPSGRLQVGFWFVWRDPAGHAAQPSVQLPSQLPAQQVSKVFQAVWPTSQSLMHGPFHPASGWHFVSQDVEHRSSGTLKRRRSVCSSHVVDSLPSALSCQDRLNGSDQAGTRCTVMNASTTRSVAQSGADICANGDNMKMHEGKYKASLEVCDTGCAMQLGWAGGSRGKPGSIRSLRRSAPCCRAAVLPCCRAAVPVPFAAPSRAIACAPAQAVQLVRMATGAGCKGAARAAERRSPPLRIAACV